MKCSGTEREERVKAYLLNPPYMPRFARDMRWQDTGRGGTVYYPIWLAYATGVIEQKHEAKLVDAPIFNWNLERVIDDIKQYGPDLIVLDTSFPSLTNDIGIADKIKEEYPGVIITIVGPPTSQFPGKIMQSKGVDIAAHWEYDLTLQELAQAIAERKSFQHVKGISYKENGKVTRNPDREPSNSEELDNIPFVSKVYKKHLNIRDYFLGYSFYPQVQIFASRGCPFQCTFCSWTQTFTGRKLRMRSVSNIADEFVWIRENLPEVKEVFFEDDTFTANKKWVHSFCEEYLKRGLDLPWACQARADLDYDVMKKMREANCKLVVVGYESGSDEILKNVKKGITVEQCRLFCKEAQRAGMPVHGNFVIGLPGETQETIAMTRQLIRETKSEAITIAVVTPFPGTELYDWANERGYLTTSDPNEYLDEQGHQKSIISYPWLSNDEITRTVDEILTGYFLTPKYIPIALKRIFRRNGWDEFKRLWHSARMFLKYIIGRRGGRAL